MSSHGIKDRVAIVGMGCTPFREHWDKGADDLLHRRHRRGVRLGRHHQGRRRRLLARHRAVRHERHHAGRAAASSRASRSPGSRTTAPPGREALRQAAYAVASGAYDVAMAVGVEKVKDSGYQGLNAFPIPNDGTARTLTAAAMFSLVVPAYAKRYGVDEDELQAGAGPHRLEEPPQRRPQPAGPVPQGDGASTAICDAPAVAGRLGVFDCAGVADGSAAAIVVRAEDAHRYTDKPLLHQGAVVRGRQRLGPDRSRLRLHDLPRGGRRPRPTPTRRPASPTRGTSWPWPRCTTASPRPSWC